MSSGNLNGKSLALSSLTVAGQPIISGATTVHVGSATPAGGALTFTGAVTQTGSTFNFTNTSSGGVQNLVGTATGGTTPTVGSNLTLATNLTTNAGAATAEFATTGNATATLNLNIPPSTSGTLTTLTGDSPGSTATSVAGVNISGGVVQRTAGAAISSSFTTTANTCAVNLVLPPYISAGGANTGTVATVPFTTNITNTADPTSLAFSIDGTSQGVVLGGNISSAGSGTGLVVAYGTLIVPATPGTIFSCWTGSGTAPAAPFVSLATGLRGGTLPATFSDTTSLISFTWQLSGATPAALAQSIWAGAITSATNTVTASCSTAFTVGQVIQWVLYG